jgi:alkyldihydroxyacetonephosphate synthase
MRKVKGKAGMKTSEKETRWWGWGELDKTYPVEERPGYIPFIQEKLDIKVDTLRSPDPSLDDLELRAPRLKDSVVEKLGEIVGNDNVYADKKTRVYHSIGKSHRDVLRARAGKITNPPDVVVFPTSEEEVVKLLQLAEAESIAVTPFCAGSSVVGGVECLDIEGFAGTMSVDTRRMDKVLFVDSESRRARFQAGIWGPELEEELARYGLYMGHAPESFILSGLGGWIATRGAGRQSTGYGKIEDMVEALRMVTPRGVIDTRDVPASATGPDLDRIICGSEGTLGIITEATMKVRPLPDTFDYRGLLFKKFEGGVQAVRQMLQSGHRPELIRVSDDEESSFAMVVRKPSSNPYKEKAMQTALKVLETRGYSFYTGAYAVLGCEGQKSEVSSRMKSIQHICRKNGAVPLGKSAGMEWYQNRYNHPYLRDIMLGWGVLTDTIETSTTWDNIMPLYHKVKATISEALADYDSKSIVTCHLSHSYETGSSLYFIFLGKLAVGREIEQWVHLKEKVGDVLLVNGGTTTHHHGVGYEHAPWFVREYGPQGMEALKGLKKALDPAGIMNPGKLGL